MSVMLCSSLESIRENLFPHHFQLLEAPTLLVPWSSSEPTILHLSGSCYMVTCPSDHSRKMFSDLKDSWLVWANPDNPGYSPNLKVLTLITSAKSPFPCKVTHLRVLRIRKWHCQGSVALFCLPLCTWFFWMLQTM